MLQINKPFMVNITSEVPSSLILDVCMIVTMSVILWFAVHICTYKGSLFTWCSLGESDHVSMLFH